MAGLFFSHFLFVLGHGSGPRRVRVIVKSWWNDDNGEGKPENPKKTPRSCFVHPKFLRDLDANKPGSP
ncbi:hypothetical protein ANN_22986 [Periplaneta americana]|uniref:Uncharacterized protein n=1 Tax=Periplaneta americana TaxID=6978 RepID=A0ABQ8SJU0_PERAM|nr:hypothetical protein ANN_22986 [Periplaneta americana]